MVVLEGWGFLLTVGFDSKVSASGSGVEKEEGFSLRYLGGGGLWK